MPRIVLWEEQILLININYGMTTNLYKLIHT